MIPYKIIIHHSAAKDGKTYDWASIRKYHITPESQGGPKGGPFLDIGYHAGVELIGDEYERLLGRPWDMDGAHTVGQNHLALGLCFIGNYSLYEPEDEMLDIGAGIVKAWMRMFEIPLSGIHKHSEYQNKECPGLLFPWQKFLIKCR